MNIRSKVITLYKNMLHLGKDYPNGYEVFRNKLHDAFMKNRDVTDPMEIKKLLAQGRYMSKELEAFYMLKKYRAMKRNYYQEEVISKATGVSEDSHRSSS